MTIFFAWLLADLLAGLGHWAEDRLLNSHSRFEFLNKISEDNKRHHMQPTAMLKYTYWQNIYTTMYFSVPLALVLFLVGCPTVVWLALVFVSFSNLVHRFAHTPDKKLNPVIRFMQWTGLFVSFEHHHKHHYNEQGIIEKQNTTGRYCPLTTWLNPILDKIQFFRLLEFIFRRS